MSKESFTSYLLKEMCSSYQKSNVEVAPEIILALMQSKLQDGKMVRAFRRISSEMQLLNKLQKVYTGREEKLLKQSVKEDLSKENSNPSSRTGGFRLKDIPLSVVDMAFDAIDKKETPFL